jgi:hypothetical protein
MAALARQREAGVAADVQGDRQHPRQDDQEGEQHLGERRDDRRAARGAHALRRHRALDDEEVGAPVAERQHEAEPHHQAEPLDPHRVRVRRPGEPPGVRPGALGHSVLRGDDGQAALEPRPAADLLETEQHQRQEAEHDQEELQHLVVDGRPQSAHEDVDEDDDARGGDAEVEVPAQDRAQQRRQRVHRDPRRHHRHAGEGDGVEPARLLVEAQLQVLGHRARLRAVIERHHEDRHEHHRRDRAHPVEVAGHDPVLGARGRHPHDFLRAQVGADETQRADPGWQRAPRLEEILRSADALAQHDADAQHEGEVDREQGVVDDA